MDTRDTRIARSSVVGLDASEVCWAVVDPIWPTVETEDELALLDQGTKGQQAIYVTMLYAQEVDNGGLRQFFGNTSGMLWARVRSGLPLLGTQEHTVLLNTALQVFPHGTPSLEQSERQPVLQALTQEERDLWRASENSIYSKGGFFGTLQPFWTRYIDSHPEQFFLPSDDEASVPTR